MPNRPCLHYSPLRLAPLTDPGTLGRVLAALAITVMVLVAWKA